MSDEKSIAKGSRRAGRRAIKVAGVVVLTLAGIVVLIGLLLAGVTWYLSPPRLTALINREASQYFLADVKVSNARFTFWSTFPRLCIATDSITVRSRTLRALSPRQRSELPADADFLASASGLQGSINVPAMFRHRYQLHDVAISGFHLNLVAYSDSINNFDIIPPEATAVKSVPYFSADRVRMLTPCDLRYYSRATTASVDASLGEVDLKRLREKGDVYSIVLPGKVSARVEGLELLHDFPFRLDGKCVLGFRPFRFRLEDYSVDLGGVKGRLNMDMDVGREMKINNLSYNLSSFNLQEFLRYLPGVHMQLPQRVSADIDMEISARLLSPFRLSSAYLPDMELSADLLPGTVAYTMDSGRRYSLKFSEVCARFFFNGRAPDASRVTIDPFSITGEGFSTTLSASVADVMSEPAVDVRLSGSAKVADFLKSLPAVSSLRASGSFRCDANASFRLRGASMKAIASGVTDLKVTGAASLRDMLVTLPDKAGTLAAGDIDIDFSNSGADIPFTSDPRLLLTAGVSVNRLTYRHGDLRVAVRNLKVDGRLPVDSVPELKRMKLGFSMDSLKVFTPQASYLGGDWKVTLSDYGEPRADVRGGKGVLLAKAFPGENEIDTLSASLGFDSIALRRLDLRSQQTGMRLSATVANLRDFLRRPQSAPLRVRGDLAVDTLQFNQLARAYMSGSKQSGGSATASAASPSADTATIRIPRNLDVKMRLSAKGTRYMNLRFYDLSSAVDVADGNLHVKDLTLSADFGHAVLDFDFLTRARDSLQVGMNVKIDSVNVVNFFKNFHTLLLMMPEMKNLEGTLSGECSGGMTIFPDMYADVPSLHADIGLQGVGLTVHQNQFIRHITRMMLIRNNGDLHISDLKVRATVHDNLLELYPFNIDFSDYRLTMEGVNNFDGNLYYHIGVRKSPVPFPFGINVEGMFHHPKFRFGGATFKVDEAQKITSDIMESNNFNVVTEAKRYMREFIEKAAESGAAENQ